MTQDVQQLMTQLVAYETEHRDLDVAIDLLSQIPQADELQLRRFKKRKLQLKDQILRLKMQLVPDIPA